MHPTGVRIFISYTSHGTIQSLNKSMHHSDPDKIELKKFFSPSEGKKYVIAQTNNSQNTVALQTTKPCPEKNFNYKVNKKACK